MTYRSGTLPTPPAPIARLDLVGVAFRTMATLTVPARWHRAALVLDYADGSWGKPACAARPVRIAAVTDESPDVLHGPLCPDCFPDA